MKMLTFNNERPGPASFTFMKIFTFYKKEKKLLSQLLVISAEQHIERIAEHIERVGSGENEIVDGDVLLLIGRFGVVENEVFDGVENSVAVERAGIGEVIPTIDADTIFILDESDVEHCENVVHLKLLVMVAMSLCGFIPHLQYYYIIL